MRRNQGDDLRIKAIGVQRKSRRGGPGRAQPLIVAVRTRVDQHTKRLTRDKKEMTDEGEVMEHRGS